MRLKKLFASAAAAITLALSGGCSAHEASAAETETMPEGAVPGPALWLVSDADTTIYLFGTVHALPPEVQWLDARIERAFDAADELVFEIDMKTAADNAQALAARGALPAGGNLRDMMTDQDRAGFEAALAALNIPQQAFDQMQPWLAAMTLSLLPLLMEGYQPEAGVEMALNSRAGNKPIIALETIEEQIDLFDTLPVDAQLAYLGQTVEVIPQAAEMLNAMVAEWVKGNAAGLGEMMNAQLTDDDLYERLLTGRNANWADWVEQRLQTSGTSFVAVGAGHLAGRGSLQDQLRERGLTVTRIWK